MWKYLRFSLFKMMLIVGFQCVAFVMLRHVSCTRFLQDFYHEKLLDFIRDLFCIKGEIMWLLSFSVCMWWIMFIDLCILIHPWIFGISQTWPLWIIFFMCTRLQFVSILLRIFVSFSSKIQAYNFLGSCLILVSG